MPEVILEMWTIYDHPLDYPDKYVARRWEILREGNKTKEHPSNDLLLAETVEELREQLPRGLYRLDRFAGDDPKILEVWL